MGFIESYKHLEKLCGEVLNDDRRISAYIDEMINTPRGSYLVRGWDDDLSSPNVHILSRRLHLF